jgi:hypothetical protein
MRTAEQALVTHPVKPVYDHPPEKLKHRTDFELYSLLDIVFIVAALVLTFWLSGLLLVHGVTSWRNLLYLLVLWVVLAYLALPRLHQLFTWLYVPDYFIGRTRTGDGLLGDPVNLAFDGTEADIHAVMQRAGWTRAEEITLRSSWRMIVSAVLRRSYAEAPVSDLFLFGRRHAFAYQQEVEGNPSQRHHIRFWPTPGGWALPGGRHVQWLAAGTYDRAVGISIFTGQITHRIDADIDVERDYIVACARYADPACSLQVIEEFSTAYHHRNGGGDRVRTDGDLPILDLNGAAGRARRAGFAVERGEQPATEPVLPAAPADLSTADRAAALAENTANHHVPPMQLVVAGLLLIVNLVGTVFSTLGLTAGIGENGQQDWGVLQEVLLGSARGIVVAAGVVLWALTLVRRRWARLVLMAVFTVTGVISLVTMSTNGIPESFTSLAGAGLTVGLVLAMSADAVREWVSVGRKERHVDVSLHGVSIH